jgi:hypothetical protein
MENPKNSKSEVLYTLIEEGRVSIMKYPYLSGFRTRVSELVSKHEIPLIRQSRHAKNKFGNPIMYIEHVLPESQKQKAMEVYQIINR